jgi:hypothetical protein
MNRRVRLTAGLGVTPEFQHSYDDEVILGSYRCGNDKPGRSSSHAIALILHPWGVRMNCVEIMPRASNGTPFIVPDFE